MHIPDGFLSNPVAISTGLASAGILAFSLKKASRKLDDKTVPLMGVCSAFVFAAQMLNFPIAAGTSGHFLGAAFVSILLGPWISCAVISTVLILQALGFADGGITALGANILNMAIIGCFIPYALYWSINKALPKNKGIRAFSIFATGFISVISAAIFCSIELAVSGTAPLEIVLPAMVGTHALIGIGEGIITATAISVVFSVKGDIGSEVIKLPSTAE